MRYIVNKRVRINLSAVLVLALAKTVWDTLCAHVSMTFLENRQGRGTSSGSAVTDAPGDATILVLIPMLHETMSVSECLEHWHDHLSRNRQFHLTVVTSERERAERPMGPFTWDILQSNSIFMEMERASRASWAHFPSVNRTYGEQLSWAARHLMAATAKEFDYLYVSNTDSRLSARACQEIVEAAVAGADCAQQSSLFLDNLASVSPIAAAEALFQSRWTVTREVFRYLAGSGQVPWLPTALSERWYQHAVGHGILLSRAALEEIGGIPEPKLGLEDAALGFTLRSHGFVIQPVHALECAEAPETARELQRQRATWVRGPLCAPEYADAMKDWPLVLQGLYDGLKWALSLPAMVALLCMLPTRRLRWYFVGLVCLDLYLPTLRLVKGLRSVEIDLACIPRTRDVVRGFAILPLAPVSYGMGGLRGLIRLLGDLITGREFVQARTSGVV
jgi:hypothetical protein